MGRWRRAEDIFLPLVSIGAPIPGIAYAPLFMLWFGLGNFSAVLLVGFVSAFPIIFNTWTGVKAVKEIWVRSAQAMGADQRRLFRHVILPGALPYILTGLRLGAGAGLAHPGRGGNARRGVVGPGLADLRRARVPQHRRDAGGRRRDRRHRPGAGEARVPAAGGVHGRALGDDGSHDLRRAPERGPGGGDAAGGRRRDLRGDRAQRCLSERAAADDARGGRHAGDADPRRHHAPPRILDALPHAAGLRAGDRRSGCRSAS